MDFDQRIITNKTNTEQINELNEKDARHKYGACQNVLLTDEALAFVHATEAAGIHLDFDQKRGRNRMGCIASRKMFDYGWFFAKRDMAEPGMPET